MSTHTLTTAELRPGMFVTGGRLRYWATVTDIRPWRGGYMIDLQDVNGSYCVAAPAADAWTAATFPAPHPPIHDRAPAGARVAWEGPDGQQRTGTYTGGNYAQPHTGARVYCVTPDGTREIVDVPGDMLTGAPFTAPEAAEAGR